MTMRRITQLVLFGSALGGAFPAQAGFEWVPPAQVVQQPAPAAAPAAPMGQYNPYPAAPAASPYAGAENFPNPVAPLAPPAANAGTLRINPYPLTQGGYGDVLMGMGPVEQAMMAESRALNPLQLGGGLTTGSKPRALAPTYPSAPIAQAPTNILTSQGDGAMSPMPGGPTAPLPGYAAAPAPVEQASLAPMPVLQAPAAPPTPPVMNRTPRPPTVAMKAPPKIKQPPVQRPAPAAIPAAPASKQDFSEAVGFGKDLPLALALSQIIPEDYALFFEAAVDSEETNVSWQGGKPWNEVLQEMLAPLGLRADIQPNLVMIRGA